MKLERDNLMDNSNLYSTLTRFGDYYPLKLKHETGSIIQDLEKFNWVQYNPRKKIDRQGLSITSLDGGMTGIPDLDSLYDYYSQTGIALDETNFTTKTPVYEYFKQWLDPLEAHLGRTHVIRLNRGAFFPPHRDNKHSNIDSFRLFLPLNYESNQNFFLLEDKKMEFKNGVMYFIDTAKMHTLFNTNDYPFYFVVANIILSKESVNATLQHLLG
jgi:hypothetical protein